MKSENSEWTDLRPFTLRDLSAPDKDEGIVCLVCGLTSCLIPWTLQPVEILDEELHNFVGIASDPRLNLYNSGARTSR